MVPEVFDGHVVDVGDGVLTAEVVATQADLTVPAHVQFPEREGTTLVVERIVERERRAAVVGETPRHLVGIVLGDGRQQADTAALLGIVVRNARFQRDDVVLIDIDLLDEIPVAVGGVAVHQDVVHTSTEQAIEVSLSVVSVVHGVAVAVHMEHGLRQVLAERGHDVDERRVERGFAVHSEYELTFPPYTGHL